MKPQTMNRDQRAAHYAGLRARVVETWNTYRAAATNRPDSAAAAYARHVEAQHAFSASHNGGQV